MTDPSTAPAPRSARILVVEDDDNVRHLVAAYLEREGYEVVLSDDGRAGLEEALRQTPDLLILDLMLPGLNGLEVAREVRAVKEVPILMLTALGEEEEVLAGFAVGADDYLAKPFSPKVLVARVRAILHRSGFAGERERDRFSYAGLTLDGLTREVTLAGESVELTAAEFDLLRIFMEHPGWVHSRESLLERVSGYAYVGDSRAIDVHVANIRKKLGEDPSAPRYIRTIRGVGYKFDASGAGDEDES